jgi:hypothetical protein
MPEELDFPCWGFRVAYDVDSVYFALAHFAFPLVRMYLYIRRPEGRGHLKEDSTQTRKQLREPRQTFLES